LYREITAWPCEIGNDMEWLKAVAQSVQDTSWKPMHCSWRPRMLHPI